MYAYARISSMLRKAADDTGGGTVDWALLETYEERELALRCSRYGDVLRKAAANRDTSALATYLLDLAKCFSQFYRACPVLAAPAADLRETRLELSRRVQTIIADGLATMTIEVLESM
jgi:arginyl-tRNA synthetase